MERKYYEETKPYKDSITILRNFEEEILDGSLENFRNFYFDDLKEAKYIGDINDPDMYLITQAIYIILWGDLYDLSFEKIGRWSVKNTYPFRGDTMNSFGSLFGKEDKGNDFAFRAKFYNADQNPDLWGKIQKFYHSYHRLGNFIVIPDRGTNESINSARGRYTGGGMRDYFDWFLIAISEYQNKVNSGNIDLNSFELQLKTNPEYNPEFLPIEKWKERFFLEPYFEGDKPKLLFKTTLEERRKITTPDVIDSKKYYTADEYLELLEDYLDKAEEVIEYRTNKIIEALAKLISQK